MEHDFSHFLPDFPRTRHIPHRPNAARDDLIASNEEAQIILESEHVHVTEKVDGANMGICVLPDGQPLVRNRNHYLRKSHQARTPAKQQFTSVWNWYYQNSKRFETLQYLRGDVAVYGEWLYAVHSVEYNSLPELFLAFDVYDISEGRFLDPFLAYSNLKEAGFHTPPVLHAGRVPSYEFLENLTQQKSDFSDQKREGVYVKVGSPESGLLGRFKMVRHDFIQGEHWNKHQLKKNGVLK